MGTVSRFFDRILGIEPPSPSVRAFREDARFRILGIAVVSWAGVELILDQTNHALLRLGLAEGVSKVVPLALGGKISMFRKVHQRHPILAPIRAQGLAIIDRVAAMQTPRHDIVHGMAVEQLAEFNWRIKRHSYPEGALEVSYKTLSLVEMAEFDERACALEVDLINHQEALLDTVRSAVATIRAANKLDESKG